MEELVVWAYEKKDFVLIVRGSLELGRVRIFVLWDHSLSVHKSYSFHRQKQNPSCYV